MTDKNLAAKGYYRLSCPKAEAFLDGRTDKETLLIKADNLSYNGIEIDDSDILAKIIIKTGVKQGECRYTYDSRLNTLTVTQDDILTDSFASSSLSVIGHKIASANPMDIEIKLISEQKSKKLCDRSVIAFAVRHGRDMTVGVGLAVNTDGILHSKKNYIKIVGAKKAEIFVKVTNGYNPISKLIELDIDKVLDNCRSQMYLVESELYDVLKMKHLMDIEKHKITDKK